jgi:acyl-CoA synthetase (AMP-forming)/AMP-acid ligase II
MPAKRFPGNPDVSFRCLPDLLKYQAQCIPDAPAILAPGRAPLTYGRLYRQIEEVGCLLRALGIGRCDRIAVLLPNGPEMAVAILAVAASATCAPMNEAYRSDELRRYFANLKPSAVIIQAGIDSQARRAALDLGIRILELSTGPDLEAGLFTLAGDYRSARSDTPAIASDIALLLLTSGTTANPKIVPLTHAAICNSAYNSVSALVLRQTDRGINMMPLFHGHGLNNNLLASLAAGASIVCAPGCEVNSFFGWLTAFQPTWYSAVPTMHQAILAQARRNAERAADSRLRFIRSASAPLPPRMLAQLEQTFETCVIESYGMTETASSFIGCNPLPPRQRKPGSVGLPIGLDVAIMDDRGDFVPGGQSGEVVARGATVMTGYDGDESATRAAFSGGWFRTGDLGYFDRDGYLFLIGRVREMINRGGEKIGPQEVDDVLLQHPAVAEAVTFAIPHATLGEDVASAVVLRSAAVATSKDIRQFAIDRIADFKVPRQVFIVKEIPKSATGKKQRVGLAEKLGLAVGAISPPPSAAPRAPLEELLAKQWAEILQVEQIGIHDDFFASGGDSLLAIEVLHRIFEATQVELAVSQLFEAPTVAEMAHKLERLMQAEQAVQRPFFNSTRRLRKNGVTPASHAQERLWKLQHALADLPFFNVLYALRLQSPYDPAVLERSINKIVCRHEIFRTNLAVVDGEYVQVIAPQLRVPLPVDDLREPHRSDEEIVGYQVIEEETFHSFDLAKGPLIRTRLLRFAERDDLLLISLHQVVCDGWSLGVLAGELVALYDAFSAQRQSPLPPLAWQFGDFAHWQRQWKSHSEIVPQLAYWREQLREPLPAMQLANPGRRPTSDDLLTERRRWTLPVSLVSAARQFSLQQRGTLFMALVAALKILLHHRLAEDDLRVATNVANRNRPGAEALIGPLANTLILRTNLGGNPNSHEVLRRVRATTLAAFDRQDLPFEELAETLGRERAIEPASLAGIMILLQNATLRPPTRLAGTLACEEANPNAILPLVTTTTYDVILGLVESSGGALEGTCIYKPNLFSSLEIDLLVRDFESVIEQMVAQPERPISAIRCS